MISDLLDKEEYRVVMGVDASTKALAFSIYEDGELKKYGKIAIEGRDTHERCGDINRKMYGIIKQFNPDLMAIESAIYVNNRRVVIDLANVYGAIIGVAVAVGVKVESVSPSTWMSHIGNPTRDSNAVKEQARKDNPGKSKTWIKNYLREARKQRTMDWVESTHGPTVDDDDVADAIAVGDYASKELV